MVLERCTSHRSRSASQIPSSNSLMITPVSSRSKLNFAKRILLTCYVVHRFTTAYSHKLCKLSKRYLTVPKRLNGKHSVAIRQCWRLSAHLIGIFPACLCLLDRLDSASCLFFS